MNCPLCNTPGLEIGNYHIHTSKLTVEIYYAICNADDLSNDPDDGVYMCDFFIARESKELILEEMRHFNE